MPEPRHDQLKSPRPATRRRYGVWGLASAAALAVTAILPGTVLGWSQLYNNQDANGGNGEPASCNNVAPWICVEWPTTSGGLSVTVEVFLASSLDLITAEPIKTDFRNAWPQWNNIAARNPHYQETTSTASDEVDVSAIFFDGTNQPLYAYAGTSLTISTTSIHRITHAKIIWNRRISWNHSRNYTVTDNGDGTLTVRADSRKVAVHELGHSEGLGHVRPSASWTAIMKQGAVSYTTVQSNDNLGIKEVYGEYP